MSTYLEKLKVKMKASWGKTKAYDNLQEACEVERLLNHLNLSLETCKILETIPMLYQGWECDEWAWLIKDASGQIFILETNHGSPHKIDSATEMAEFIKRNGERYQQALESLARCRKFGIAAKKNTTKAKVAKKK